MSEIKSASFPLRALNLAATVYAAGSVAFFAAFVVRFYANGISSYPADWTSMSEMLGALFGPPLALWSIALVLKSIELQQDQVTKQQRQHDQMLERENLRLDPGIQQVDLAATPMWQHGSLGGKSFHLTVEGDADWLCSTIPDGPSPAAITNPNGTIEVVLWKKQTSDVSYRGFVQYRRSNGIEGWYWISVSVGDQESDSKLSFALSRASSPVISEDGIRIEVSYPE